MVCRSCGHENREGARFCGECGRSLSEVRCPACAAGNPADNRFCDSCGEALAAQARHAEVPDRLAERMRRGHTGLEGERKLVTVLFADVMGSMELAETQDPEAWRSIMDRFFSILCNGVHRYEGTVDKFTGDGVMALFGAPIAHEDHALRACLAALDLQRELAAFADELRRTQAVNLATRIGLNSGEVVVGAIGEDLALSYTAIGHTVGLAQRMESLAAPGSTYVTAHTAELVEGFVELRGLGEFEVKGASAPLEVFELTGVGRARTRLDRSRARGFSRFVGRDEELALLDQALARAREGHGQVVGIVAEAGVGKSRLCHEFAEGAIAAGIPVYRAAGTAHTRSVPFSGALAYLREYFGLDVTDAPAGARERVAGRLLLLDRGLADELPLLFDFLGIPDPSEPVEAMAPEARARRLLGLVRRVVTAQHQQSISILEDLHWLDDASHLLLQEMVDSAAAKHNLIVLNFRPEYRPPWSGSDHYTEIVLRTLGSEDAHALLRWLLGDDPSFDGLPEEIERRTGGNPFFTEEVVLALAEDGTLGGGPGAYHLARPLEDSAVPPTVHAVLAARIDRLAAEDKALLQIASVIGAHVTAGVMEKVAGHPVEDGLRALEDAEFLVQESAYPEAEYAFRHPLVLEVAYSSQLSDRRRAAHAAVARALMERYADSAEEQAPLIAQHLESAGETLEAARWRARAAHWAGTRDPGAAFTHWQAVQRLADALPEDTETRFLGIGARTWQLQLGWRLGLQPEEAQRLYEEGRELAERAGDDASLALLLTVVSAGQGVAGHVSASSPTIKEAWERAQGAPPQIVLAVGQYQAYHLYLTGQMAAAHELTEQLIEVALPIRDEPGLSTSTPLAWAYFQRALNLGTLGALDDSEAACHACTRVAREREDLEAEGWAHMGLTWLAWIRRDGDALASATRTIELAERTGSTFARAHGTFFLGLAHVVGGDLAAAVEHIDRGLAIAREHQTALETLPMTCAYFSEAKLGLGDVDGALETARTGYEFGMREGIRNPTAILTPYYGRALVAAGDLDEAERVLREGLEFATAGSLRTAVALHHEEFAGLLHARGDDAGAEEQRRLAVATFEAIGAPVRAAGLRRAGDHAQPPRP